MTATEIAPDVETPAPDPPPRRTPRWWRLLRATVPPLVALAAGWALLASRSGVSGGSFLRPSLWGRWDSGHYLAIARIGYNINWNCRPSMVPPHAPPGHYLCGNAGWFPGYPAAMRLVSDVAGISIPVAALVVSWACWYLVLALMWRLLADARSLPARWVCLLIAAFFPGQVYFATIFPISLTVAAMLACLYAATRASRPWLGAGVGFLAGFVAAYSYITAVALAPALLATAFLAVRGRRRVQALLPALGVVAGFGAVLLTMRFTVGLWNAYFLSAAKYGVGAHSPLDTLRDRLGPLWTEQPPGLEFLDTTASQTLLTLSLVTLATLVTLGRAASRPARAVPAEEPASAAGPIDRAEPAAPADTQPRRPSPYARWYPAFTARLSAFDLTFLLAAVGVWLVPYVAGGQASTYRSEAFVILTVPLLRRLPAWMLVVPLGAVVLVAWHMAPYFFNAKLR